MSLMYDKSRQEPFNIIDNVYYVGTRFVSCHFFASDEGHILIDTAMPGDGPTILGYIEELGFNTKDIAHLLITHAHIDHTGSAAYIAQQTGAAVYIAQEDAPIAIQEQITTWDRFGKNTGTDVTAEVLADKEKFWLPPDPVKIDHILKHGDTIKSGTTQLEVLHTPGHSAGSCSFAFEVKHQGKTLNALLPGGIGANAFMDEVLEYNIFGANIYDYITCLKTMQKMDVDIWLGAHPFFNNSFEKFEKARQNKDTNPFIETPSDTQGGKAFLNQWLKEAEEVLLKMTGD